MLFCGYPSDESLEKRPEFMAQMNRQIRKWQRFATIVVSCALVISLNGSGMAQVQDIVLDHGHDHSLSSSDRMALFLVPVLGCIWVFVLGASIGSFLNVVIYRLPAGLALGKPKSRCPRCETSLSIRDNIPVFGWLFLRGKCRYCGLPISSRYPLIETAVGCLFLCLMVFEVVSGGANLPLRPITPLRHNPIEELLSGRWDLPGIFLYHACYLTVLLAMCMIGCDGHRPQKRLVAFGLIVALSAGSMWPNLRPLPMIIPVPSWLLDSHWMLLRHIGVGGISLSVGVHLQGVLEGFTGAVCGWLCGRLLLWQASRHQPPTPQLLAVAQAMMLTGAVLGWQSAVTIMLVILPLVALCDANLHRSSLNAFYPVIVFVLTTLFVLFWRIIDGSSWMIGHNGWTMLPTSVVTDWLITVTLIIAGATIFRTFSRAQDEDASSVIG